MSVGESTDRLGDSLRVVVLDANPQTRNRYLAIAMTRALARHPRIREAVLAEYDNVVDLCRGQPTDLLLVMGGSDGFAGAILRAAGFARASVLWTGEDPYERPANLALAGHFDLVCSNDAGSVAAYGGGAIHLPFAASRDIHAVEETGEPLFDVLFVGTAWPNRIALLDQLIERLPAGLRLKLGLSGNPSLPGWNLADPNLLTGFRVAPRDFARLAARSRLVLTLDRDFSTARGGGARGTSPPPRLFEIGLTGTAQVYLTTNGLSPACYQTGHEIAVAKSVRGAVRHIERLLGDDGERRRLGCAAQQRTRAEHLYEHRVEAIFAGLGSGRAVRSERWRPGEASARKRILAVAHNLSGIPPVGGAELYQDTLMRALPEFDFVLFASSGRRIAVTVIDTARHTIEAYPVRFLTDGTAFDPQREHIFHEVLQTHAIDLVHVQHLKHHSWAYPMVARLAGVPLVATAHDYYLACTRFNLIGEAERFCGIDTDRTEPCDVCLARTQDLGPGAQARRREIMRVALGCFSRVLFNTVGSRDLMRRIYPDLDPARCEVVGMTGDPATLAALTQDRHRTTGRPDRLAVAVIGNVTLPKGGALLVEIAARMQSDPVIFHVHGRVDEAFVAALSALPNVVVHGPYDGPDLGARLAGQSVSLHLSVWPETYCITLDEARAAGLLPVVLGYGALAERVSDGVDGYVVDPDRPFDLVERLRAIQRDPGLLTPRAAPDAAWFQAHHDRHAAAISAVYSAAIAAKPVPHGAMPPLHDRAPSFRDLGERFNAETWDSAALELDASSDAPAGPAAPEELGPPPSPWFRRFWKRPAVGAQGRLDLFAGPHDAGELRVIERAAMAELRLGGWLVPRDKSAAYTAIEVALVGTPWRARIAAIVTDRTDVADRFGAPHLKMSGFVSLVELGHLPEGDYAVEVRGRRQDGREDVLPSGRIRIV